jgi:hypothetical protein
MLLETRGGQSMMSSPQDPKLNKMTKHERIRVREALINAGFRRDYVREEEPNMFDRAGDGVYTEYWRHKLDRTLITLEWDRKTDE